MNQDTMATYRDRQRCWLRALEEFAKAAKNLNVQWEGLAKDEGSELYPFAQSFDEISTQIQDWSEIQRSLFRALLESPATSAESQAQDALNAAQRALAMPLDAHRYNRNPEPWLLHMREAQGAMSAALSILSPSSKWMAGTNRAHTKDSDCTIEPETRLCKICGVDHSGQCDVCGGRGFHTETCPFSDSNIMPDAGRTAIGNTPTCEDCGKPQDHCECGDADLDAGMVKEAISALRYAIQQHDKNDYKRACEDVVHLLEGN